MYYIKIILKKEIKELIKENRLLLMLVFTSVFMLYLPFDLTKSFIVNDKAMINLVIDYYISYFSIVIVLFISYSSLYSVFFKDKVKHSLDSLLATPISLHHIWSGKTVSVFLVGYLLSFLLSLAFIFLVNFYIEIEPIIVPSYISYLTFFLINPIICLCLIGNLGILYLILKDDTKIRLTFFIAILVIFYFLKPSNLAESLSFWPVLLALAFILSIITYFSSKLLKKERVILSAD